MFIIVPLIRSTGLAIVAEANLRFGVFCPKKLSSQCWNFFFLFGLGFQTFLEFSQDWKSGCLFGLIMHCSLGNGTWECLVFDFNFFCGIVSFYVPINDAVFLVTSFSIFDQCLADVIFLLCSFLFICSVLLGYWSLHKWLSAGVFLSQ